MTASRIANSPNRPNGLPLYRTGDTWNLKVRRGDAAWMLVRESDEAVAGPFSSMEKAETYIAENGGGYLDWGSSGSVIPHRAQTGQVALLHHYNGIGWKDWRWCEEHPRATLTCGHSAH